MTQKPARGRPRISWRNLAGRKCCCQQRRPHSAHILVSALHHIEGRKHFLKPFGLFCSEEIYWCLKRQEMQHLCEGVDNEAPRIFRHLVWPEWNLLLRMLILSVCCVAYIEYLILFIFIFQRFMSWKDFWDRVNIKWMLRFVQFQIIILTEWTREINRRLLNLDNQKYVFRCVLVLTVVFLFFKMDNSGKF